jgi:Xaa-Pro aminopeptidase
MARYNPSTRATWISLWVSSLFAIPAHAQIPAAEFAARRDSLAARIGTGVVLAFGARTPVTDFGPPTQLPAFHYLTNYDEPDAAFVLVARSGHGSGTLFTVPVEPRRSLYYGQHPDSAHLEAATGLHARSFGALSSVLDSLVNAGLPFYSLADFEDADFAKQDSLTRGAAFLRAFAERHPGLTVADAHPMVNRLRARKSPAEQALLRRAAAISVEGHVAAMQLAAPGLHEYDLQAALEYAFRRGGASRPAYGSIVGAGAKGTQLHYMADRAPIEAGDMVVMDAGAEYEGYAADVTRTIPVSGTFSAEQRALYQLVRDAQAAAERNSAPGLSARAAEDSSFEVRARGLAALGYIESPDATMDPPWTADCKQQPRACRQATLFTIHGISHGLGLAVHDPAQFYAEDHIYRTGDAFTIEPGIYINAAALDLLPDTPRNRAFRARAEAVVRRTNNTGIRIEDDYLITDRGLEWISQAPREIAEVEAAMGGRPLQP